MSTYGVLGVGSIATAIVDGLCNTVANPPEVVLSPRNADRAAALAGRYPSVRVAVDNQQVVNDSDTVIVCLLPIHAVGALGELAFRPDQGVISAVAGCSIAELFELVAPATTIARSIPVPAVATRGSRTPVHPATPAATTLYDRLGGTMVISDESAFESLSAASATVAAYFIYLGTIAGWLADNGMPAADARRYVADTFATLTDELASPNPDFTVLAQAHTTPGGLNEQFALGIDAAGIYDAVRFGLDAVRARIVQK